MKLLEKILVPIDFENNFKDQVELAGKLAGSFNSEIILFHVLPAEAERKSIKPMISKQVDSQLQDIGETLKKNKIKYRKTIRYGNIFDRIMSFSMENRINLILLSSASGKGNQNYRVGVITEKLIRKSEKPVWVIRPGNNIVPERLLCPVDFSDPSTRALNNAIKIARTFKSMLHIINIFEPLQESFSTRLNINYKEENTRIKKENEEKFNTYLEGFNIAGIEYKTELLTGKPYETIVKFADQNNIDLIFMGATGKSVLQRVLLGSVTEKVVRELPSSMVITKSENLLKLKMESDISNLEKHFSQALKLKDTGFYDEAIEQLNICLQINDLHVPAMNELITIYELTGNKESAEYIKQKLYDILDRLWDSQIEKEIRKRYKL